jgi:hypothetical protein
MIFRTINEAALFDCPETGELRYMLLDEVYNVWEKFVPSNVCWYSVNGNLSSLVWAYADIDNKEVVLRAGQALPHSVQHDTLLGAVSTILNVLQVREAEWIAFQSSRCIATEVNYKVDNESNIQFDSTRWRWKVSFHIHINVCLSLDSLIRLFHDNAERLEDAHVDMAVYREHQLMRLPYNSCASKTCAVSGKMIPFVPFASGKGIEIDYTRLPFQDVSRVSDECEWTSIVSAKQTNPIF